MDSKAEQRIRGAAIRKKAKFVIAPSVVYEAIRTGDQSIRKSMVSFMAESHWTRLRPEAFTESEELLTEIRAKRPSWLIPNPDLALYRRNRYDWIRTKGGFWDRITQREDSGQLLIENGIDLLAAARIQAKNQKLEAKNNKESFDKIEIDKIYIDPDEKYSNKEQNIEDWRMVSFIAMTNALNGTLGHDNPYREWLGPYVDLSVASTSNTDWAQFWLQDAEATNLPRQWLRWAIEYLQKTRRYSDGVPCDAQLGTYLLEADIFVTADKIFVDIVNKIQPSAPSKIAVCVLIKGGEEGVEQLLELISA